MIVNAGAMTVADSSDPFNPHRAGLVAAQSQLFCIHVVPTSKVNSDHRPNLDLREPSQLSASVASSKSGCFLTTLFIDDKVMITHTRRLSSFLTTIKMCPLTLEDK